MADKSNQPFRKPEGAYKEHVAESITKIVLTDALKNIIRDLLATYTLFRFRIGQRKEMPTLMLKDPAGKPVSLSAECETLRQKINWLREERARYVALANDLQAAEWDADDLLEKDEALAKPILDIGMVAIDPKDSK
jgi:hypothetical protein